jgi:hypothetical protein
MLTSCDLDLEIDLEFRFFLHCILSTEVYLKVRFFVFHVGILLNLVLLISLLQVYCCE